MTTEELLKPRYKVIADYPRNRMHVGRIFKPGEIGVETQVGWDKYPHLFKPIEWWEERKESDMPQYLKVIGDKERPIPTGVYKVRHYSGKRGLLDHVRFEDDEVGYMSWFLPATKEEYETQNK